MDIQTNSLVSARKKHPSHLIAASPAYKKTPLSKSLANLEEDLFVAQAEGNTRKAYALKMIIKRLQKMSKMTH